MTPPIRYFLDCDDDGHVVLIPASRRAEWETFINLPYDYARRLPDYAKEVDGFNSVTFIDPQS